MTPADRMIAAVEMTPLPGVTPGADYGDGVPIATHSGFLELGKGVSIKCYQLSDGTRVLDANDPIIKGLVEELIEITKEE